MRLWVHFDAQAAPADARGVPSRKLVPDYFL